MTPDEVMKKLNSRNIRIDGAPVAAASTALNLVDLAVGVPVAPAAPVTPPPAPPPEPKPSPVVASAAPQPIPQPSRTLEVQTVVKDLFHGPHAISTAQAIFDEADQRYKAKLVEISIQALSMPIFPGKKAEDPLRCAANDTERDMAIQKAATTHAGLLKDSQNREAALRDLQRERNQFEAAKLLAALLTSENKLL